MRYYKIVISNPATNAVVSTYTSYANGKTIPGALNIEMDIPTTVYAQPMGQAWVRVWGIGLAAISQASNLVGMNIIVYAGMQAGLPLANPKQAGIIMQGQIYQAFGNWIGVDQTLDIFATPYVGTIQAPSNVVLNWKAGTPLSSALAQTLSTAFPGLTQKISISQNLVLSHDEVGYYSSLTELAQWVQAKTKSVIGGSYQGVDIHISETTVNVQDGTTTTTPIAVQFQELIGQPTWIDTPFIQFKTIIRSDIGVGDYVTMPMTLATTTAPSMIGSPTKVKSSFTGSFKIQVVRHVGNFRQPDASSWVTTFNAYPYTA